jgi:hypothetical protein
MVFANISFGMSSVAYFCFSDYILLWFSVVCGNVNCWNAGKKKS